MQLDDENKRKLLGDILHQVRFPVMDPDQFVKCVGSTKVLTPEESLDIILFTKGSTPHKTIPFLTTPRTGTWEEEFFNGIQIQQHFVGASQIKARFTMQSNKSEILLSSVYFVNATSNPINRITLLSSEGVVNNTHRVFEGHELYEAAFSRPVPLQQNQLYDLIFRGQQSFLQLPVIQGNHGNRIVTQGTVIMMQKRSWYCLVGFKFKTTGNNNPQEAGVY